LWGIGRETLRRILVDEPGVVKIRMGHRKSHTTYSVPASVVERIHARLAAGDGSRSTDRPAILSSWPTNIHSMHS
jgi:hypothetical protein